MGLWKKRECDIETIEEAKKRLEGHINRFNDELKAKRSPERHMTVIEESEENGSQDGSKIISMQKLASDSAHPDEEEKKMAAGVTVGRRSLLREHSVRLTTNFGQLESLDSSIRRPRKRRATEIDLNRFNDNFSIVEEREDMRFSANYFIHDYSSDTDIQSHKSCPTRLITVPEALFPPVLVPAKNMSENDIKYYQGIDEEGIIGMQNGLVNDYYEENPELRAHLNRLTFRNLVTENDFLLRIFPLIKEEKPGKDLYNYGVVFQFLIVIYILFFFSQMTGEKEELSETFKFKRFRTEMIFFMFVQIMLILLDRFFYISNTFDQIKEEHHEEEEAPRSIIQNLLHNENKHNFFKLIVYVCLVILVHFAVIWYFPITGNYKINEQIYCDANGPCNDLNDNHFLWGFYILYMIYFSVTALQFRYGLPEIRKGHFMYEKIGFVYTWLFRIFFYIPFLFEIKTYIDWTFTKTSLKIWDWFTFETIYSEFY